MNLYDDTFFKQWGAANPEYVRSCRAVAEEIFAQYRPASLIDFGCGAGFQSQRFIELGVRVIPLDMFPCPPQFRASGIPEIRTVDLSSEMADDFLPRADLALCLDVAEHIVPERAAVLVGNLTRFSDLVVFTAAPPDQGGTGHVNEQPFAYWQKLFNDAGFRYCRREAGYLDRRGLARREEITLRWMTTQMRVFRRGLRFPYPPAVPSAVPFNK